MKKIDILLAILLLTIFISCKSKKTEEVEVKPVNKTVTGDFEEYVSIVDGTYKLNKGKDGYILAVKLKFLKSCDVLWLSGNELKQGFHKGFDSFTLELLDETGTPLGMNMTIDPDLLSCQNEPEKLEKALKKGSGEDFYTFYEFDFPYGEELETQLQKVKKFKISSSWSEIYSGTGNTNSTTEEAVSGSTSDCDQIFKDYEAFMRSNLAIIKKIKADPSNMANKAEFAKLESESASMEIEIANCLKSDPKLSSRLLKMKQELGL